VSASTAKTYHHGELRAALVQSALELLTEIGVEALSLRAVARRAGVSAMAPYRHYPDKEALLAAVATRGFEGLREALQAADMALGKEALVAQAVAYVRYALANPALFRLMFSAKRTASHPGLDAAGDAAYAVLAQRVAALTPGDEREARTLGAWSLVHGLASLYLDGMVGGEMGPADAVTGAVARAMIGTAT
jgi:AcrR family transcriptional regulator